ncbi:unnamed protein product [Calypogeia fissa]
MQIIGTSLFRNLINHSSDNLTNCVFTGIVFSRAGVQALADVVMVDPTGASMVSSATHILGHAASHAARLKEEAYAVHHSGDLFYPFVVEVFGALQSALDQFLRSTTALCVERRPYPPVSVVTAFLRQRVLVAL